MTKQTEYAVYSSHQQGYYTTTDYPWLWSPHAFEAKGFSTEAQAIEFIRVSGYENTTQAQIPNGAYVVCLMS